MNFRPVEPDDVDVNLTPLVDVVFLLLIFFMVTTTFDKNSEMKIELPTASNTTLIQERERLDLLVDSEGRYYINGREVLNNQPETLFRALRQVLDDLDTVPPLVISADANANYQSVITAMDIAGRLGLNNFSVAISQSKRK